MISSYRHCNKFLHAATVSFISLSFLFLIVTSASAKDKAPEKSKIVKSFISEDASYNGFAFSMSDCINAKDGKDSFTFEDEKVTWSAVIRGGLGKYDKSNYAVYWYSPDGSLFEKQTPKFLFMDCTALKSSLPIDNNSMENKAGLWKIEVTYKDLLIDNRYFYLSETGSEEITQDDIDALEGRIVRAEPIGETAEEVEEIRAERLAEKITAQPVDDEKSKLLTTSRFRISGQDIEYIKDSNGVMHISRGSGKIYWRGKFRPLIGITSPKIEAYWLTPAKEVFSSSSTSFIPTGDASFSIKADDISEDMLGEWSVVVYVNKEKILEEKFLVEDKEAMRVLVSKQKREEAQDELVKMLVAQQEEEELQEGSEEKPDEADSTMIISAPAYSPGKGARRIYTVLQKGVIAEGVEDIDDKFWSNPARPLAELEPRHASGSSGGIAILVYPSSLDPYGKRYFFALIGERYKDNIPKIQKNGIEIRTPVPSRTIAETYGYVINHDLETGKNNTCFFTTVPNAFWNSMSSFTEEQEAIGSGVVEDKAFWRDISFLISSRMSDHFLKKGYTVIDLTPARSEFEKMKLDEIAEKVSEAYGIRRVFLLPYCAYTKWTRASGNGTRTMIGLRLSYDSYIYELGSEEPVFSFGDDMDTLPSSASGQISCNINFYSKGTVRIESLFAPTQMKPTLKDGVIDDRWLTEKTLQKFMGYEKGVNDKVRIGGELFEKLAEAGY